MNVKIVFFSGTGNTKFLSEKMAGILKEQGINEVKLIPVETAINDIEVFEREDTILGIGYPVYDLMPPKNVIEFINKLRRTENHLRAFVFSSYTTNPLDSNYYIIEKLQEKGYNVIAQENYKAPGASSYLYANPKNPFVKGKTVFSNRTNQKLHNFVISILNSTGDNLTKIPIKYNCFNKFYKRFSKITFGTLFYRNLKKNNNCINCGVCAKACPDGNLCMDDGILHIKNSNGCMNCLRCVQVCPKMAINFTSSKRTGSYTREVIERAYENAISQQ